VVRSSGHISILVCNEDQRGSWYFDGKRWVEDHRLARIPNVEDQEVLTASGGSDRGVRMRDVDVDGDCDLIVGNPRQQAIFEWNADQESWERCGFSLPESTTIVSADGQDAGLRFVDLNEDGRDDIVFSNESYSSVSLFKSIEEGWVTLERSGDASSIPRITRRGTNNGVWFANGYMWLQNEDTDRLPDGVDRRSFAELLEKPKAD